MPAKPDPACFDKASRRWHALAERRLAYYIELYRSGRWQRYYSKERFATLMLDVIRAVKTWEKLAGWTPVSAADKNDLRPAA
jgi:uncharacterized repeat protein (TIGR03809 family)